MVAILGDGRACWPKRAAKPKLEYSIVMWEGLDLSSRSTQSEGSCCCLCAQWDYITNGKKRMRTCGGGGLESDTQDCIIPTNMRDTRDLKCLEHQP